MNDRMTLIFQHIQLTLAIVGIGGNLTSFLVFRSRSMRTHSYSFYSQVLSVSNSVVLLHSLRHWSREVAGFNIDLISPILCTLNEYQPYVACAISLWTLTLISVDRLVTVVFHTRYRVIKKRACQIALVVLVLIYSLIIYIRLPLNSILRPIETHQDRNVSDSKQEKKPQLAMECHLPRHVLAQTVIIFLVNLIMTSMLINNLISIKMITYIYRSRRQHTMIKVTESKRRADVRDRNFSITSVGLNLTCVVMRLPFAIALITCFYLNLTSAQLNMIFTIVVSLAQVDNASVFFVNICVNSLFRQVFLEMIGFKPTRQQQQQSNNRPSSDSNLAANQLSVMYVAQNSK